MAPGRDEIMEALRRILAWPEIARSPQLARFMSYIVERTLAGEEDAIKAYSIAVDVFGRPADFDPQADPIVRVQARRLRGLLDDYYADAGRDEPVRIRLPIGRYVPEFLPMGEKPAAEASPPPPAIAEPAGARGRPGHISLPWFAVLIIAGAIAGLSYGLSVWQPRRSLDVPVTADVPRPTVVVDEFKNLANGAAMAPMVAGLAIELVTDLEQFEDLSVRYGGDSAETPEVASLAPAEFVLTGIVRVEDDMAQYSAILTDAASGNVVWSQSVGVEAAQASQPAVLDEVSRRLALVLGSSRGPLHAPVRAWLAAQNDIGGHEELYLCLELFHLYRDSGLAADADRARACFSAIPETERLSPLALAATGSLTSEAADPPDLGATGRAERLAIADANLSRAVELDPVSSFVWEQWGRFHEATGAGGEALSAYGSAIQLNPANGDALAAYARLLALSGNLDEAEPLAEDALRTPEPPPWYFCTSTLAALRKEAFPTAVENATRYAMADRELGPVLAVMASLAAGDTDVVNRYLPQILDLPSFRSVGIVPRLRKRLSDEVLLADMRAALTAAGVPAGALAGPF